MYKGKKILGLIPARGGSKRLPRKNIIDLGGKPLIVWTIEAGLRSKYLDKVVITSEDEEILDISKKYNVKVIKRPYELATDEASTIYVIMHVLESINENYDYIVLLQPTSPLRNHRHIDEAIEYLFLKNAYAVVSVCEVEHSPLWTNTLPENLSMVDFIKDEIKNKRSQDLPKYYRLNGAIYICNTKKFLEEKTFFLKENIFAYIMDRKHSIDIDNEIDFKLAELLITELLSKAE